MRRFPSERYLPVSITPTISLPRSFIVADSKSLSNRIFARQKLGRESFIHDGHARRSFRVMIVKGAPGHKPGLRGFPITRVSLEHSGERNVGGLRLRLSFNKNGAVVPVKHSGIESARPTASIPGMFRTRSRMRCWKSFALGSS